MTRRLLLALPVYFALITTVFAHPHAFVECRFSFVMDNQGLVGFKQRWALDEMTTVSVLDVVDANRDGSLSAEEKIAVRDLSLDSLLEFHYFTFARINGKEYPVLEIKDFAAELKNGKLIYKFFVPCRVTAIPGQTHQVKAAVYDESFYTVVVYVDEGTAGIDPTKDPLFAKREAPAQPEDFKRFSDAVGLGKFKGKVRIQGDVANFKIASKVKDEPDMAYFYEQITPQAFVLSFELK